MRKGYKSEYTAKRRLIKQYGERNVLKLAIGQAADFIVLAPGENRIEKIVEIKKRKEKYYKSENKDQHQRIVELAKEHKIRYELWTSREGGYDREMEVIYEPIKEGGDQVRKS